MEVLEKIVVLISIGAKIHSPAKSGILVHRGAGALPSAVKTTATLLESPLVFTSDLWHFPVRGRRELRNPGESFSAFVPLLPSEIGTQGKKKSRMWLFKFERKEHPPTSSSSSEGFLFFFSPLHTGTAPGSRILFSGEEAGPASVPGTWAAFRLIDPSITWKHPSAAASLRQQRKLLCSGIFCGTTTEINSCNDTLEWDEDKFILLFPHSHNFYTSPHKSAQAASTLLVLSKEEK